MSENPQTPQQLDLLDNISQLQNQSLNPYDINLPQLIGCENQSSSKNSAREIESTWFSTVEWNMQHVSTEAVL